MAFVTLILGLIIGFGAGMIVAAGNWRNALTKLGVYALNAARPPAATQAEPTPTPMPHPTPTPTPTPMATRIDDL